MKKEEAVVLVMLEYQDYTVGKVTETDNYFLISILPKHTKSSESIKVAPCDDGLKAVDKKTRKVFTYNPILHGTRKKVGELNVLQNHKI